MLDPAQMTDGHLKLEIASILRYPAYLVLNNWSKLRRGMPVTRREMISYVAEHRRDKAMIDGAPSLSAKPPG